MKSTDNRNLFTTLIASGASSGDVAVIPATQPTPGNGRAAINVGFPAETFVSRSAGGVPPFGADENGFLNLLSAAIQSLQADFFGVYDATFSAAIGGYPLNAVLSAGTAGAYWVSTVESNTSVPGAPGANWQSLFAGLALTNGSASNAFNAAAFIAANANGYTFANSSGYYEMDASNGSVAVPVGGVFTVRNTSGALVPSVVAPAAASNQAVPLGQALETLSISAAQTVTLSALRTEIYTSGSTAFTITLEPGGIVGQRVRVYGGLNAAVTVASNVTTGFPDFCYPDGSFNYSYVIPFGTQATAGIDMEWDGTNWRAQTFGQPIIANATAGNQAVALGQATLPARMATFTTNGSWTVPPGITKILVSGCAGGAGGTHYNPGGAGQPVINQLVSVVPGDVLAIAIGAPGVGNTTASSTGGGNTTIVDSTTSATLLTLIGASGVSGSAYNNVGTGYPRAGAGYFGSGVNAGAPGASGPFGGGGCGAVLSAYGGGNAYGYGAGGGQGYGAAGGNGAPGLITLEF